MRSCVRRHRLMINKSPCCALHVNAETLRNNLASLPSWSSLEMLTKSNVWGRSTSDTKKQTNWKSENLHKWTLVRLIIGCPALIERFVFVERNKSVFNAFLTFHVTTRTFGCLSPLIVKLRARVLLQREEQQRNMSLMDSETGEIVMRTNILECHLDAETGESFGCESETEMEPKQFNIRKSKFNVPRSYLNNSASFEPSHKCCLDTQETFTLTSKKRVIELKEVANPTSNKA